MTSSSSRRSRTDVTVAFVTGIAGQDGTLLARRLVREGAHVHGLVLPSDDLAAVATRLPAPVRIHVGDLADGRGLRDLLDAVAPDEVYNLGGISSVAFSWQHPALTGEVSGVGAVNVFEAALQVQEMTGKRVRVLQASSAEIFGQPDRTPQDESTTIRPISPYGAAKAYAHEMAAIFRTRGLHVATCILYNHESPLRPESFVTRKITAAAARIARDGAGTLTLGDLSVRRDWGWAEDYVDAMVRAVRYSTADDFVIATGVTHTVEEFVAAAMQSAGVPDWQQHVALDASFVRPADAGVQVGDAARAHDLLDWVPTVSFEELVRRMVEHDVEQLGGS